MKSERLFAENTDRVGLVIVFPPGLKGLFNPHIHRVVREVEERLTGVFVTYGIHGSAVTDVDSAVSAARFAGCSSAVVISADDWFGEDGWIDWTSDTLWSETCGSADIQDRAQRVVDVYNSARSDSGLAA